MNNDTIVQHDVFPGYLQSVLNNKPHMLFLDDRTKRIEVVRDVYKTFNVTIVVNVKECFRHLQRRNWDVVSLDHDLNGCDFEDPDNSNTGMEVVRYIEKTGWPPQLTKPSFWVHSSNLFAAHLMVVTLSEMGFDVCHKPFIYPTGVAYMKYDEKGNPLS